MTQEPNPDIFTCYCVDLSPAELRRMILERRWTELETLGVGHVCTGCRADYRLLKGVLKRAVVALGSTRA